MKKFWKKLKERLGYPRYKVYRLKEIQDYIKNHPEGFTWETYTIQPIYTNYTIDCTDPTNKIIHEVHRKFSKSCISFLDHITIKGVYDDCYIKIRTEDSDKLFSSATIDSKL